MKRGCGLWALCWGERGKGQWQVSGDQWGPALSLRSTQGGVAAKALPAIHGVGCGTVAQAILSRSVFGRPKPAASRRSD